MEDIPKDIARVGGNGRESRFLRPYLLAALQEVPPAAGSLAEKALAVVAAWDENGFQNAVTSTTLEPGQVIFAAWLAAAQQAVFADELGDRVNEASSNLLLHVLDGASSGVPPSRDYFNGQPRNAVLAGAFGAAVTALAAQFPAGSTPDQWAAPRGVTKLNHAVFGTVATFPTSNRATYAQIVVGDAPGLWGESVFTLGQSGFAAATATGLAFDPHFFDQLPLYTAFQYK